MKIGGTGSACDMQSTSLDTIYMNWRVNASAINAHLGDVYVHAKGPNTMATWAEVCNIQFRTDDAPAHEPFAASIIRCRYNARFMKEVGLSVEERGEFIEWIRTSLLEPESAVPVIPSRLAVLNQKQTDSIYDDDARCDDDATEWVRSSIIAPPHLSLDEIAVIFGATSPIIVNDLGLLLDSEDMDDLLESTMQIDGDVSDIDSNLLPSDMASFDVPSSPGVTSAAMPAEVAPAEAMPAEVAPEEAMPAKTVPKVMSTDPYGDVNLDISDDVDLDLPYDVDATDLNGCPV